jgi:Pyruvate/2-oxoacid:ferredoxin oxidoreductase gamma subunit
LLRNFSKVNEQTLIILNNEPIIPKSSVLGITSKLKDEHTQNDVNHSQPEWIVKKTGELQKLYPLRTIKEQISLQHIDKEVKVIKNLISFSTSSRILDLNFTSLVLDELGSTTYLNLVMTSFLATLMDTWLDYKDIKSFLKREFQDIKSLLEKNQNALKFGEILAINYSRLRNFS